MSALITSIQEEGYAALARSRGEILIQRGQGKAVSLSQFEIAAVIGRQSIFPGQKTAGVERHEIRWLDFDGERQDELDRPRRIGWGHAPFPLGHHQDIGHFDDPERRNEGLSLVEEEENPIRFPTCLSCRHHAAETEQSRMKRFRSVSLPESWTGWIPLRIVSEVGVPSVPR